MMTIIEQTIWMEQDGAVLTITINRPDALNAFDRVTTERLAAALRTAEHDPSVRAIVLTGAGRAFSAGQDVKEMARETAERGPRAIGNQLRDRYNPVIVRLRALEKPVIAAINGVATGAGLGIALACDLRIASDQASFVLSPVGIGLIPGVGMTRFLPALIGLARASELTFTGERIDASRALEIGLVNRVVAAVDLVAAAREMAAGLTALPTRAIGLTKRAFNHAVLPDLVAHLDYEAGLQEIAAGTEDHREGLAAVLDKRRPLFTGR
jgi:2-(1,2-epoxy-1,2-dihydrophenyl)acetyl-CoA isomerase